MRRVLLGIAIVLVFLLRASELRAQTVFVGIPGSRCQDSTAVADTKATDFMVNSKKSWASGFLDGAHAALGMEPVRSSVNFTYARLQDYCGRHPDVTLREAMLALVAEDRPGSATSNPPGTSDVPQIVFRPAVFRLDPPTFVLWTHATTWEIVTADSVNIPSKVPVNLSYFETAADCATVRSWLAGLAKGPAVSGLNISFQCFPSNYDPRGKK